MMEERTLSQKYHFKGRIMNMRVDEVELSNGQKTIREVCEHCDGVGVLPVTDEGNVILVSQFRYPFGKEVIEVPAGKVDEGEAHFDCGVRELSEETGYTADEMTYLGFAYVSPGCMTEKLHLYLARGLHKGNAHPDDGEFLDVLELPLKKAVRMCENGEISDGKTVILLLRAARILGI